MPTGHGNNSQGGMASAYGMLLARGVAVLDGSGRHLPCIIRMRKVGFRRTSTDTLDNAPAERKYCLFTTTIARESTAM